MTKARLVQSLIAGRNIAPLSDQEIKRVSSTFLGLDNKVNVRYEPNTFTRFVPCIDEDGQEYGEVVFSNDVYPGQNIANPNAALSLKGAAAHELSHFYRWQSKSELPHGILTHIDEAMTSLEAALRYSRDLDSTDTQGLISDSLQRLRLYLAELDGT